MHRHYIHDNWHVEAQQDRFFYDKGIPAPTVTLPHDAVILTARDPKSPSGGHKAFFTNGSWEYERELHIPPEFAQKHVVLHFEGVYAQAMVYINGCFVGQRPYGYSEFYVEADPFLRPGEKNKLKVAVHTADDSRWYSGAGIYRPVSMLVSGQSYILPDGVRVSTPTVSETQATVLVETRLRHDGAEPIKVFRLMTQVLDKAGNTAAEDNVPVTLQRGEETSIQQRLYIKAPALWDVDIPNLYTCSTVLQFAGEMLDSHTTAFGIRSLGLDPENGLQINGKTVKLRGACIHHDHGPLGAASYYRSELRRVEKLKEAGFNAIRMAHHPAGRALLEACDRVGMLVMDEAFDTWSDSKRPFDYGISMPGWWQQDLESMVNKDYNHPCVVMYSIGNEIFETGNAYGIFTSRQLADKIRELDGTRYIINCINGMLSVMDRLKEEIAGKAQQMDDKDINQAMTDIGEETARVMRMPLIGTATEEAFSSVDIAGYNYMHGRYEMDRDLFQNRIICGSETHPNNIDRNWRQVLDNGHVIGDFTWTGWDYLGEVGIGRVVYNAPAQLAHRADYPWLTAWCGDIDLIGDRRTISYYREIVFGLRKEPYIAVFRPRHYQDEPTYMNWSWTDTVSSWGWPAFEGKPIKIEVYSADEEVELLLNGQNLGRQPAGEKNRYKALFDTVYQPGVLEAVAYCNGVETGRYQLRSADNEIRLALQAEHSEVQFAEGELVYVGLSLVDREGVTHVCKDQPVEISVEGAGCLVAFGTANPKDSEGFASSIHTTFNGRALAIIRPAGKGEIKVSAKLEGQLSQAAFVKVL